MRHPNIEAFIVCWNEEAIIRHTLNHYASFCSKITLIDNYSTDNTIAVARENFPEITVTLFDTQGEIRDDLLTQMKNNCWKESKADYVIVCDTDEFLYADDLHGQLKKLEEHNVAMPVVIGYNMGSVDFPGNFDISIYEQVQHGVRDRNFDKQIIFNPRAVTEINYSPGCHFANPVFKNSRLRDPVVEFKLLHYKYLSKEYLYNKHMLYSHRLSQFNKEFNYGAEYLAGKQHIDACFDLIDKHLYKII